MKLYRNLDRYLLARYPIIWETKVHFAMLLLLPLAIILFALGYMSAPSSAGFRDEPEALMTLAVIPTLAIVVYWWILNYRFKANEHLHAWKISSSYTRFFSYMIVFFTGTMCIFTPQLGHLTYWELAAETDYEYRIKVLEEANRLIANDNGSRRIVTEDKVVWEPSDWSDEAPRTYSHQEAKDLVKETGVILSDLGYRWVEVHPERILEQSSSPDEILGESRGRYLVMDALYDLYDLRYDMRWRPFNDREFWYGILAIMGYLSLLTWQSKYVTGTQYAIHLGVIAAQPVLWGVFAALLFMTIRDDRGAGTFFIFSILLTMFMLWLYAVRAMAQKKQSMRPILSLMLVHVVAPLIPLLLLSLVLIHTDHGLYRGWVEELEDIAYYTSWAIALLTFAAFERMYKEFWSYPKVK